LPDKQEAADLLANMNQRFNKLISFIKRQDELAMYKNYVVKDSSLGDDESKLSDDHRKKFTKFRDDIARLIKNYNPDAISENTPDSAYTAYSENKGQKIVFCLRSKKTNQLVDLNTMMFVGLHELTHLMTKSIGHNPEFWDNFRVILRISIRTGNYDCKDYNVESKDYCGTMITDTPLKCTDV
jgi:predicted metal-dependent hydrolase